MRAERTKKELLRDEITELKKQVKEKTKIWERTDEDCEVEK